MNPSKPSLESSLRALADDDRRRLGPHPSADRLLAYHAGELAEDEREGLRDHLALCADCARTVLDLAAFPEVAPRDPERTIGDAEVAGELAALRRRLADTSRDTEEIPAATAAAAAAAAFGRRRPRRPDPSWLARAALPLAAVFALAAVGLGFWATMLRVRVATLEQPRGHFAIVDLTARDDARRRGEEGVQTVRVDPGASFPVLILNAFDAPAFPGYAAELRRLDAAGGEGEVLSPPIPLVRTRAGNFNLALAEPLPAGAYRATLYGVDRGGREPLAVYDFTVE